MAMGTYQPYGSLPYQPNTYAPMRYEPSHFMPPVPAPAQAQTAGFQCRPVTNRSEVEAFQIPFDGSTTYFVDTSTGKLYSKTFDFNTGSAPIVTYVREAVETVKYATIDDLNALREELTKKPTKSRKDVEDE